MLHTLVHIYGPLSIHSFGLILAIGIIITVHCALNNPARKRIVSQAQFVDAMIISILAGLIGSRLLFIAQNWHSFDDWTELFVIWSGGLSLLGGVIGIVLALAVYLRYQKIPALPFLDLIALYAPLLQAIARLGCFFAGCCFGVPTTVAWAVTYTDHESAAPLCTPLHPTQLYSALALALIFVVMHRVMHYRYKKPGQLVALYLFLISVERFCIDFLRGDREFINANTPATLSTHQHISVGIASIALLFFMYRSHPSTKSSDQL